MSPLPIHHHPPSSKVRFIIQSSDVLQQQMRINVSEEGSSEVIWYKERYLSDTEIIENVVHNPTGTVCWSIHKPKRGWYIRLRHPAFPPGTFIPFLPVPPSSPYHVEAALSFNSRTGAPSSVNTNRESSSSARSSTSQVSAHSYPPTPTTAYASPVSPTIISPSNDVNEEEDEAPREATGPSPPEMSPRTPQAMQISQFILAPHSVTPQVPTSDSLFSRAISVIKSHRPSHSKSFTLSRVPDSPHPPPPPYTSQMTVGTSVEADDALHQPLTAFLIHHDRTPVFTVGSFTGVIEIDAAEERMLGVDRSFWITVALTYLEFLENRESYLAALSD